VVMPNFTPMSFRRLYEIYPGKAGGQMSPRQAIARIERMVATLGRFVDLDMGHSLKSRSVVAPTTVRSN
jgi:biotin synthase